MRNPDSDLPPVGASVRLVRDVECRGFPVDAGERARVLDYDLDHYAVEMDDPPDGTDGVIVWDTVSEFLADIEPADLGRDPEE